MFGRSAWALAGVSTGVILAALFQNLVAKKKNIAQIYGIKSSVAAIAGAAGALMGGLLAGTVWGA